jgi:hypothetical protein
MIEKIVEWLSIGDRFLVTFGILFFISFVLLILYLAYKNE